MEATPVTNNKYGYAGLVDDVDDKQEDDGGGQEHVLVQESYLG